MELLTRTAVGQKTVRPIRILQFGGGNFLRAFADYLVEILNTETTFDAGVALVKPTERGDYEQLRAQEGLFHVITEGILDGEVVQVTNRIDCVQQIIQPYLEWGNYLGTATLPELRFVLSNTTEAGITFSEEPMPEGAPAKEFPGKLTQWLYHRFNHFNGAADKGCILLPCELIEQNGETLKDCVLQYAAHWELGTAFAEWVEQHNTFCNTLVDRIVPGAPGNPEKIWTELGFEDQQLVTAEPYLLWAIEGPQYVKEELPFEQTKLNVVFTDDLAQYRTLKVRILNGAHTAMVPVGLLNGISTVRAFVEHPEWSKWLDNLLNNEVAPTLPYDAEIIASYIAAILDRFRNPYIHHKLSDIALNSTSKFKVRLLPTALAYYEKHNTAPESIAQALGALIQMYKGELEGLPRDNPEVIHWFSETWSVTDLSKVVAKVLANKDLWDEDIRFMESLVIEKLSTTA